MTGAAPTREDAATGGAPEVSVLIPCLNEEQNVPSVVDKLVRLLGETGVDSEILIIDDCSDDYTFREAMLLSNRYAEVRALHKGLPRGIGHAIRFGIEHARGRVGVVVMGDGVDPIAAIPDFRDEIVDQAAVSSCCSRATPSRATPRRSRGPTASTRPSTARCAGRLVGLPYPRSDLRLSRLRPRLRPRRSACARAASRSLLS